MRVFIRNRTKDSCLKIPFLIYFRHFRTIMGFTGNLNRSWNSILEYKNKFWGGNKSCVCAFYTPHICDGFFQFVCHTIQILQTCGEQRIHPFLIWIFTGMLFKLFTLHADIPFLNQTFRRFFRLVDIKITFQLKGINLQTVRSRELPDCYSFFVTV